MDVMSPNGHLKNLQIISSGLSCPHLPWHTAAVLFYLLTLYHTVLKELFSITILCTSIFLLVKNVFIKQSNDRSIMVCKIFHKFSLIATSRLRLENYITTLK